MIEHYSAAKHNGRPAVLCNGGLEEYCRSMAHAKDLAAFLNKSTAEYYADRAAREAASNAK